MFICAPCMCSAQRSQRRALDPIELELHMVVSRETGAETEHVWFFGRAVNTLNVCAIYLFSPLTYL